MLSDRGDENYSKHLKKFYPNEAFTIAMELPIPLQRKEKALDGFATSINVSYCRNSKEHASGNGLTGSKATRHQDPFCRIDPLTGGLWAR